MQIKVLAIAVVTNGEKVLLRKKPDGSPPYKETWYLFGAEISMAETNIEQALQRALTKQAGIRIKMTQQLSWDTEVKPDHDGTETYFVYLDCLCEYVEGVIVPGDGIEKIEWISRDKLPTYDFVASSFFRDESLS